MATKDQLEAHNIELTAKVEKFEELCEQYANTVSDVLSDLDRLNIGLAKDKLYPLLKELAELSSSK